MLSPEEKQALIEFAGPMFALGKEIDSMYFNDQQTKTDGMRDGGISGAIKTALERDFRSSQVPQPQYIQPPVQPQHIEPLILPLPNQYIPQPPAVEVDVNQLELKFNKSEQEKTNDLLKKQSKILEDLNKKFDKLIKLIQNESENNA
jgi:hypothetical protein